MSTETTPRMWGHIELPTEAVMTRRDQVRAGDVVISSHYGRSTVESATTYGGPVGTTEIRFTSTNDRVRLERYDGDSLIPVIPAEPRLPLVVFRDVAVCDGPGHGHEITLVTDCATGYAWGASADAVVLERNGTEYVVRCNQINRYDEPVCDGHARFNLDTEGTWTADPDSRALVAGVGTAMPR